MNWKRVSADRIRSGVYEVQREMVFEEVTYYATCGKELLTVCHDSDAAKRACERHAEAAK